MTAPGPSEHISDLLPAYINGRLDKATARQVHEHLLLCSICQRELISWKSIKDTANNVAASTPLSSLHVMNQVWEKIDASAHAKRRWSPDHLLSRFWMVSRSQVPLIHKSIWVAAPVVCAFALLLTLLMAPHTLVQKHFAANLLVLFIVIVGASGSAFIYGSAIDPGFELTIATPTSVRLVMLYRLGIVLGYNCLLAMLASAVFAIIYGGNLWGIVQLWVGPLFFLSSLALAISLFVSSTFALICISVIEVLQNFSARIASHIASLSLPTLDLGSTSPTLLLLTLLLVAVVLIYVPRQPRLAS